MSIERNRITVYGLPVQIVRKAIKNLHLGVYPPQGRVRVAAPLRISDDAVRLAVIGKLGWIKRQRARFEEQPRESRRELVSGESHYFLGRRYRLRVESGHKLPAGVVLKKSAIELRVPAGTGVQQRERLLHRWYRQQLKAMIPPLVEKWQARLGVQLAEWGIKKMKTRWGTCNVAARRIWLNLELAKKLPQCLEYIVVHELAHLLERHHDDHFLAIMDRHLPRWRQHRAELNSEPLAQATWTY
jgi:predicted metal-dependent hydrolase